MLLLFQVRPFWVTTNYSLIIFFEPTLQIRDTIAWSVDIKHNMLKKRQSIIGVDTSGFSGHRAGIAVSSADAHAWYGTNSLMVKTDNAYSMEGFYTTPSISVTPLEKYTASAYLKGFGDVRMGIVNRDEDNSYLNMTYGNTLALSSEWQRIHVTSRLKEDVENIRVGVFTDGKQDIAFMVDGIQLEIGELATFQTGNN